MRGTTTRKDGVTTHRCTKCGERFEGTGKRGRPFKHCPSCRVVETAKADIMRLAGAGEV